MKSRLFIILLCCIGLSGCASKQEISNEASKGNTNQQVETNISNDNFITFNGTEISSTTSNVTIDGSTLKITKGGTYQLQGQLENGQVVVDCKDQDVKLIFNNVMIGNNSSAPIDILEAKSVKIELVKDSQNLLTNQNEFIEDENKVDGVIFSKSDLVIGGEGSLTINSCSHGIVCKDTLTITSGTYSIFSNKKGISVNDVLEIENGNFEVSSLKDAIVCENDKDDTLGHIIIKNGKFVIDSKQDGIYASHTLKIENGDFNMKTGEGSASVQMKSESRGFFSPWQSTSYTDESSTSTKGFKAGKNIEIFNGTFVVDSVDDAIHCNGDIVIYNGNFDLKTGDDGMHADNKLHVKDGNINISYCYEGLEAMEVVIDGGKMDFTCFDDGMNASGNSPSITINNGDITIISDGDCIDSNNSLTITGGSLNLICNGNGNTALDCDGNYSWTGGDITTNDGSETNPHMMGGHNQDMNMNKPGQMPDSPNAQNPYGPGPQKPQRW